MARRLFFFAAYDPLEGVGPALEWYIKALVPYGEIICIMSNRCPEKELEKLKPYCLHVTSMPHNEAYFGSHMRAYKWAVANLDISEYTHLYMMDNSVLGPTEDLGPVFKKLESYGIEVYGMSFDNSNFSPYLHTWFFGMNMNIVMTPWFKRYITTIHREAPDEDMDMRYAMAFSRLIVDRGCDLDAIYNLNRPGFYDPFFRKEAFTYHDGTKGYRLRVIFDSMSKECRQVMIDECMRTLGEDYFCWLMRREPWLMLRRSWRYRRNKGKERKDYYVPPIRPMTKKP